MDEMVKVVVDSTDEQMSKAIDHLVGALQKIRAGKASPAM